MGPIKPLSLLAVSIHAQLLARGGAMDLLQIWLRVGGSTEELTAALEELRVAKRAELRHRVTPNNWQVVDA